MGKRKWPTSTLARRSEFLGMSHGTARAKLVKQILWSLLQETGRTDCFRCGSSLSLEDLSIDHKEPWMGISADLYWDMANIAFSHNRCNSAERRVPSGFISASRKVGPDGTRWCSLHRGFSPLSDFGQHASTHDGMRHQCTPCRKRTRARNMVTVV